MAKYSSEGLIALLQDAFVARSHTFVGGECILCRQLVTATSG